jgi:CheY-like chemotaxis protein
MSDLQRLTLEVHARQLAALCELHRLTNAPRAAATERAAPESGTPEAETAGVIDGARTEAAGVTDAPEATADGEPHAPGPGEALIRRRILVVDDVEAAASLLGRVLESMGHETRIAHDGPKALAIAKEYRPDVILLDLGMPGMSGFVVARLLRAQVGFEGITLIAVTGHGRDEDRRQAVEAGFDHHLLKPVSAEQMRALLDQLPVQS